MTHNELVQRAIRWLLNSKKCQAVISEMSSGAYEEPDAIGWCSGSSYLIECKTSMNDMMRDIQKPHRRNPDTGMGVYRYIMADKTLANMLINHQAKPAGWGLLAVSGPRVLMLADSTRHTCNRHGEIKLLSSAIQRVVTPETIGVAVRAYTHHVDNPRAELHVSEVFA